MGQRSLEQRSQKLQAVFEDLLESRNVYYNPPSSVHMRYPAIRFTRSNISNTFANDAVYGQTYRYEVTVIDEDPDCKYVDKVSKLPMCSFNRAFVSDNLYHNVFTLYF